MSQSEFESTQVRLKQRLCLDVAAAAEAFLDDGYLVLRGALSEPDASIVQGAVQQRFELANRHESRDEIRREFALMRMFEFSQACLSLIGLPGVVDVVRRILGPDCHVLSQTALRTTRGRGIINWHIDDALFFPAQFAVEGLLPTPPCYSLSVLIALTDTEEEKYGPTQFVARSHRFARAPLGENDPLIKKHPVYSFFAAAGDALILNHQTWHRGAQNASERVRSVLVTSFGRRFIQQRMFPFVNYCVPDYVLAAAGSSLSELLGRHQKGPLG